MQNRQLQLCQPTLIRIDREQQGSTKANPQIKAEDFHPIHGIITNGIHTNSEGNQQNQWIHGIRIDGKATTYSSWMSLYCAHTKTLLQLTTTSVDSQYKLGRNHTLSYKSSTKNSSLSKVCTRKTTFTKA